MSIFDIKRHAEEQLQAFGARIRRNLSQGQKDFKSGKTKYYNTINPFK